MDPTNNEIPPQAARLAPKLRALADRGIYFGTSSWKYDGWLGSMYRQDRYITRAKFSNAKFEENCLTEYAETFPTVCGDLTFYQFPSEQYWANPELEIVWFVLRVVGLRRLLARRLCFGRLTSIRVSGPERCVRRRLRFRFAAESCPEGINEPVCAGSCQRSSKQAPHSCENRGEPFHRRETSWCHHR